MVVAEERSLAGDLVAAVADPIAAAAVEVVGPMIAVAAAVERKRFAGAVAARRDCIGAAPDCMLRMCVVGFARQMSCRIRDAEDLVVGSYCSVVHRHTTVVGICRVVVVDAEQ